jgi:DNA mismatch repair protein PMS2
MQIQTQGAPSKRTSVTALWGAKALENVVDLDVAFEVGLEKSVIRRLQM